MGGRQLQHPDNLSRGRNHFDCSSEERTLCQYISHHSGVLDQSLVQNQLGRQQNLLHREIIKCLVTPVNIRFLFTTSTLLHVMLDSLYIYNIILYVNSYAIQHSNLMCPHVNVYGWTIFSLSFYSN